YYCEPLKIIPNNLFLNNRMDPNNLKEQLISYFSFMSPIYSSISKIIVIAKHPKELLQTCAAAITRFSVVTYIRCVGTTSMYILNLLPDLSNIKVTRPKDLGGLGIFNLK
ncbi:hypothetical protein ACJX0J_023983, partial [Zea mays]